jgi:lysophospholipase L1-like esterase
MMGTRPTLGSVVFAIAFVASLAGPISGQSAPAPATAGSPSPDGTALTYVAFGDSWAYGAHCNGCVPFPELYADGLSEAFGHPVTFIDLTTNGGGAESLLRDIKVNLRGTRDALSQADIVIIATGMNDLNAAWDAAIAGTCGGSDGLDCLRDRIEEQRAWYDGLLTEIETLRDGAPTAIRLVTTSNEFLTDPQWAVLGSDFPTTGGVEITRLTRDVQCEVADLHGAVCVDLGLALNGPDLLTPLDVNTQEGMQAVADVIMASGLDELQ